MEVLLGCLLLFLLGSISANSSTSVLPQKLYAVIGLEGSGTRLLTRILSQAVNVTSRRDMELRPKEVCVDSFISSTEIQHLSLPWGSSCLHSPEIIVEQVLYPSCCTTYRFNDKELRESTLAFLAEPCRSLQDKNGQHEYSVKTMPRRFFVNVTSHIEWYVEQGVDAVAVVILRDEYITLMAKTQVRREEDLQVPPHCSDTALAMKETKVGMKIITEAIERLPKGRIVLVSYETLMAVGEKYMNTILQELSITPVNGYLTPLFKNGNRKYVNGKDGNDNGKDN